MSNKLYTLVKSYPNVNSLIYTEYSFNSNACSDNITNDRKRIYHRVVKHIMDCDKCHNTRVCMSCAWKDDEDEDNDEEDNDDNEENEEHNKKNEQMEQDKKDKEIHKNTICYACDDTGICESCPGMKHGTKPILVCTLGCGFVRNFDSKECKRVSMVQFVNDPINVPKDSFDYEFPKYSISDRVQYNYYSPDTHFEQYIDGIIIQRFKINNVRLYKVKFRDMSLDLHENSLTFVEKDTFDQGIFDKFPSQLEMGCAIRNFRLLETDMDKDKRDEMNKWNEIITHTKDLCDEIVEQGLQLIEAEKRYIKRQQALF